MEEQQPKLTAEQVQGAINVAAKSLESPPDAKVAGQVMLELYKRNYMNDVAPEDAMALAEKVQEITAGVFGGVIHSVVRISKAKSFAEQQREIVYLTSRLVPKEE